MDDVHDLIVEGVDGVLRLKFQEGQSFLGLVLELFLHHEGHGNVPPLVDLMVADETIHPGPQDERLADGRRDDMEERDLILGAAFVFPGQIGLQGP